MVRSRGFRPGGDCGTVNSNDIQGANLNASQHQYQVDGKLMPDRVVDLRVERFPIVSTPPSRQSTVMPSKVLTLTLRFSIVLTPPADSPDGVNGYPACLFKRKGRMNWTRIIARSPAGVSAQQSFGMTKWPGRKIVAVVDTDGGVVGKATHPHFAN